MSVETAADQLLSVLVDEGITHLFLNPGTDTAPIQEAFAARRAQGRVEPVPVLCLHEHVALSAAIGGFMVTQRPQAVMVHVDCGTLNLGGAVHNAQRNGVPAVIFAGRTPYSVDPAVPGYRNGTFQWQQEQIDQAGTLRTFGKWSMEIPRGRDVARVVRRAFQVADTDPRGLCYVMPSREALMEAPAPMPARSARPTPAGPDPRAVARVAAAMAAAERPLIMAQRVGRNPDAVPLLAELSNLLCAPEVDVHDYVNVPPGHRLAVGDEDASRLIENADAILLLDVEVPWVPASQTLAAGVKVFQVDVDCAKATMPSWAFPFEIALNADTLLALPALYEEIARAIPEPRTSTWPLAERIVAEIHSRTATRGRSQDPKDAADAACAAVARALPDDAIVLEEAVTNRGAAIRQLNRRAGGYFAVGASSLGWSVGAAIGAKLAAPERPVVAICGDGSFNFSVPTAALWTSRRSGAPFVTVILDNRRYAASKVPVEHLFPEGRAVRNRDFDETDLEPEIDYAAVARACGADGTRADTPEELVAAVRRALARAEKNVSSVITTTLPKPG